MPTRKETTERKFRLMRDLRLSSRDGAVGAGDMALSQRELARRYGLSMYTVGQLMQQLVEEGALHTVPRVGTFIGAPVPQAGDYYLVLLPSGDDAVSQQRHSLMCAGFEERIAHATLTMRGCCRRWRESGK
jgi:DNA-binding GntR family transcriptional regulator